MDLIDLLQSIISTDLGRISSVVIVLSLIQISPLKINPWSWIGKSLQKLFKYIGKSMNDELYKTIDSIRVKLDNVEKNLNQYDKKIDNLDKKIIDLEKKIINKTEILHSEIVAVDNKAEEREIINKRVKILRFCDEILHDHLHTKEHFDQILTDITDYNEYSDTHPNFKNHIIVNSINMIEEKYREHLTNGDFL